MAKKSIVIPDLIFTHYVTGESLLNQLWAKGVKRKKGLEVTLNAGEAARLKNVVSDMLDESFSSSLPAYRNAAKTRIARLKAKKKSKTLAASLESFFFDLDDDIRQMQKEVREFSALIKKVQTFKRQLDRY